MKNLTLLDMQNLRTIVEGGSKVSTVDYDPQTIDQSVDPEGDALAAGWTEWYREDSASLVEVIYTKP